MLPGEDGYQSTDPRCAGGRTLRRRVWSGPQAHNPYVRPPEAAGGGARGKGAGGLFSLTTIFKSVARVFHFSPARDRKRDTAVQTGEVEGVQVANAPERCERSIGGWKSGAACAAEPVSRSHQEVTPPWASCVTSARQARPNVGGTIWIRVDTRMNRHDAEQRRRLLAAAVPSAPRLAPFGPNRPKKKARLEPGTSRLALPSDNAIARFTDVAKGRKRAEPDSTPERKPRPRVSKETAEAASPTSRVPRHPKKGPSCAAKERKAWPKVGFWSAVGGWDVTSPDQHIREGTARYFANLAGGHAVQQEFHSDTMHPKDDHREASPGSDFSFAGFPASRGSPGNVSEIGPAPTVPPAPVEPTPDAVPTAVGRESFAKPSDAQRIHDSEDGFVREWVPPSDGAPVPDAFAQVQDLPYPTTEPERAIAVVSIPDGRLPSNFRFSTLPIGTGSVSGVLSSDIKQNEEMLGFAPREPQAQIHMTSVQPSQALAAHQQGSGMLLQQGSAVSMVPTAMKSTVIDNPTIGPVVVLQESTENCPQTSGVSAATTQGLVGMPAVWGGLFESVPQTGSQAMTGQDVSPAVSICGPSAQEGHFRRGNDANTSTNSDGSKFTFGQYPPMPEISSSQPVFGMKVAQGSSIQASSPQMSFTPICPSAPPCELLGLSPSPRSFTASPLSFSAPTPGCPGNIAQTPSLGASQPRSPPTSYFTRDSPHWPPPFMQHLVGDSTFRGAPGLAPSPANDGLGIVQHKGNW